MINVFKIADRYLVLNQDSVLSEERSRAKGLTFKDYYERRGAGLKSFDYERSIALGLEQPVNPYFAAPSEYENYLKDSENNEGFLRKYTDRYKIFSTDFVVPDSEVSPVFKQIGGRIYREYNFYIMRYDEKSCRFICTDRDDNPCRVASVNAAADSKTITIHQNIFAFKKADYKRLLEVWKNTGSMTAKQKEEYKASLSPRDAALVDAWRYVWAEKCRTEKQNPYSFHHEMTHIMQKAVLAHLDTMPQRGKMSPENQFRIFQYMEKGAHLSENLLAVKKYLAQADSDNFDMFPEKSAWLVKELKNFPAAKRKDFLAGKEGRELLIRGTFSHWDNVYGKAYDSQFAIQLRDWAEKTPVSFIEEKSTDIKEYHRRLKAILTFKIENPLTGKEESVDFSEYIRKGKMEETIITPQVKREVLAVAEATLANRHRKLKRLGITPQIIAEIQKIHWRDNLPQVPAAGNLVMPKSEIVR